MKHFTILTKTLSALAFMVTLTANASEIIVSDNGSGTGTATWTNDNTYILDGFVFVNDGQTLTIEAGTVVKGMPGSGADASALVVARGGKIMAMGTASEPIIFTFQTDALDGSTPYDTRGQWGGLIVLGNAGLNSTPGETQIEGIPETEPRGLYGGNDDEDDSGVMQYISIRHGGTDIGAGNEINGLTLGGVGSTTVIEHVEVISNADDGIEFFGGTAEVKWATVAFCGDDSFDYDEGWRGKGQFWFAVQDAPSNDAGDRGGEHDGGTDPEDGNPLATPVIYNASYFGRGIEAGKRTLTFRDNAGGQYNNSIFFNWGKGIDIENLASGEDSYARFEAGDLSFSGNCFYNVAVSGDDATGADLFKISMGSGWASAQDSTDALAASTADFQASFMANGNGVENPGLNYQVAPGAGGDETGLGVVPTMGDATGVELPDDEWYTDADYKGAFNPANTCATWLDGWTMLDQYGFIGCYQTVGINEVVEDSGINLYPNPTSGVFTLTLDRDMGSATIEVVDLAGNIISSQRAMNLISDTQNEISLVGSADGIYIVRVIGATSIVTNKIIKK